MSEQLRYRLFPTLFLAVLTLTGCDSSEVCISVGGPSPTGFWRGDLTQVQSDCQSDLKNGVIITVGHNVSTACSTNSSGEEEQRITLIDESGSFYVEVSSSDLGGGSFIVESNESGAYTTTKTISYDNIDGDLADAELKIRKYRNDRIVCSELYTGQVRRN